MTFKIKRGIKKRNKAWSIFIKCPSHQNKENYRKLRNSVKIDIRNAKKEYECKIKFDPKSFYAYVNSKSKVGPLQDTHGRLVEDCV